MASRLLHSPGLQSTDVRFPNRPVYLRRLEEKARAEEMKTTIGVLQMGIFCVRHGAENRGRGIGEEVACENQNDYTKCKRLTCPPPAKQVASGFPTALSLTAETELEKMGVF